MKNMEITGRTGVTTIIDQGSNLQLHVFLDHASHLGMIRIESAEHYISVHIDELREILARWNAHI